MLGFGDILCANQERNDTHFSSSFRGQSRAANMQGKAKTVCL